MKDIVLETQRLKLRRHRLADFPACLAMWSDPAVTRYISGEPSTQQQVWSRLLTYVGHWELLGFGYWVVMEKATGNFVGEVGFADCKRDIQSAYAGIPKIGWVFASQSHGKGYATEATAAAVKWGDTRLEAKRTFCIINHENIASIRVAQKIGYREAERTIYNGEQVFMYARDAAKL